MNVVGPRAGPRPILRLEHTHVLHLRVGGIVEVGETRLEPTVRFREHIHDQVPVPEGAIVFFAVNGGGDIHPLAPASLVRRERDFPGHTAVRHRHESECDGLRWRRRVERLHVRERRPAGITGAGEPRPVSDH